MDFTRRGFLGTNAAGLAMVQTAGRRTGPNDRINFGFIGAGARAHELMRALLANPGVQITAVVDAYSGRTKRTQENLGTGVRVMRDYREVIGDASIDAVVVATPDHWHKTIVVDALRAGKDVYCEKPLTFRSSEGLEIIAAAKETGKLVQVGSQGMSGATGAKTKEMVKSGKLGKVTIIRAAYNRNTASGAWIYPIPPDAGPSTVNWDMFLGSAPKRAYDPARFFRWRCYQDYSGGIATDLFVHLCTLIHYVMDAKMPSKVIALGELYRWKESRDVPDTLNAVLEYPEGFVVNLSSTFNNQSSAEGSFQFLGTEGTLNIANGLEFTPESVVEDNRWIVESWPRALEAAYWQDPKVRQSEMPGLRKPKISESSVRFREQGQEATIVHFANFLESIRTRKPYWQDAVAGHHAASCAHMVNQSVRTGKLVEWDFHRDDIKA